MKKDQIRTRNSHFLLSWAGIFFVNASQNQTLVKWLVKRIHRGFLFVILCALVFILLKPAR